jgi:hypothetical protein
LSADCDYGVVLNAAAFQEFAVMIGGASAALTGLLFVSVSINRDVIARDAALRASAAQTLVLLVIPLIVCAELLIPDQRRWSLSLELITTAVLAAVVIIRVQHHSGRHGKSRTAQLVDRRETSLLATLFLLVAAIAYWAGGGGGLYWVMPAMLLAIVAGVLNAWYFLVGDAG